MSMFVCAPTDHFRSISEIEAVVKRFKQVGGKLPPSLEALLAAAQSGRDIEDHLNAICDETFQLYVEAENVCAAKAGFKNVGEMERMRPTAWSRIETDVDPCLARVEIQYQANAINKFFDTKKNKELFLKFFKNIMPMIKRYIKEKLLKGIRVNGGGGSSTPTSTPSVATRAASSPSSSSVTQVKY